MRRISTMAVAGMLALASGCAPSPSPPQATAGQPDFTPLAARQDATLGGGACLVVLPSGAGADQLEDAFNQTRGCRRSRALRIDKLHAGGQLSRANAAAQIIELRAEARRDVRTLRDLIWRLAPEDRRRLTAMLDKADAETQKLDLGAG